MTTRGASARTVARISVVRNLDYSLIVATLALMAISTMLIWSATAQRAELTGDSPTLFVRRHIISLVVALVFATFVMLLGHQPLKAWVPIVYLASIAGLLAVLVIGTTVNGARAWIHLPAGLSIQPGELAKVGLVVGMAYVLAERIESGGIRAPEGLDVLWALGVACVPIGLVVLQPDVGTAMVLTATTAGILALSGIRGRWLIGLVAMGGAAIAGAIAAGVLADYQIERFTAFLDPEADPRGIGYNTVQARLAIGSGGFFGRGLFHGPRTSGAFVPEQHTDFVFTVAGEELGFAGSAALLLLITFVLWRGIRIAGSSPDIFGRLVAGGVVCWLAVQTFENVGMTLGLAPVTGVPLPFVSYGGSSLTASLVAIGLLQNIHLRTAEQT